MERPGRRAGGAGAVAVAMAAASTSVFPVFLTGALAVQLRHDLRFGPSGLGLAVGCFFGASALTSTGFGRLAEAVGSTRVMRGAAVVSAAAMAVIALVVASLDQLLGVLVVAGVANGATQPAVNAFLARRTTDHM
ncbi:MAG: MFS transporter, partial [Acidimicrobiales bacterium]